jgi:hypothetical protein
MANMSAFRRPWTHTTMAGRSGLDHQRTQKSRGAAPPLGVLDISMRAPKRAVGEKVEQLRGMLPTVLWF